MARKIVWVSRDHGWGCSECAWVFVSSVPLQGNTIDEMKRIFEAKRDKAFTLHVCTQQSRSQAQELRLPEKTESLKAQYLNREFPSPQLNVQIVAGGSPRDHLGLRKLIQELCDSFSEDTEAARSSRRNFLTRFSEFGAQPYWLRHDLSP